MKRWRIRVEAEREIEDASRWYERQREGLGDEFLSAVRERLQSIRAMSSLGAGWMLAPRDLPVHRYFVRRFPYAILVVELEDEHVVVAVMHLKRRPGYWRSRIRE